MDQLDSDARLLGGCEPDHSLPSSDLSNPTTDPSVSLPLAEAFPFMSQEQLLQLLSSNAGLPSLLPPFLGLPAFRGLDEQPTRQCPANQCHPKPGSPLNVLNQGELPLNLVSLLNPPGSAAAEAGWKLVKNPLGFKPSSWLRCCSARIRLPCCHYQRSTWSFPHCSRSSRMECPWKRPLLCWTRS